MFIHMEALTHIFDKERIETIVVTPAEAFTLAMVYERSDYVIGWCMLSHKPEDFGWASPDSGTYKKFRKNGYTAADFSRRTKEEYNIRNQSTKSPISVNADNHLQTAYMVLGSTQYHRHDEALDLWNNLKNNKIMPLDKITYKGFFEELLEHLPWIVNQHDLLINRFGKEKLNNLFEYSFEVDVSQVFGQWFTKFILDHSRLPNKQEVVDIINELIDLLISDSELKNN